MSEAAKPAGPPPHADGAQAADVEHDRVRALILARRNVFVAAALAGLGMGGGGCKGGTCLTPVTPPAKDGGREREGDNPFGSDGGFGLVPRDAAVLDPRRDADARVCLAIE